MTSTHRIGRAAAAGALLLSLTAGAGDWPEWGRDASRNMISLDTTPIPVDIDPGEEIGRTGRIDPATTRHVRWIAKLGSQSYGNPVVSGGRVIVGTNNESPRDGKYAGDRAVVKCFDEKTGGFLWQLNLPKLGAGKVSDWEFLGICSSAAVSGDRVYVVTNLGEVVCLDLNGMADGNQGVTDEGAYVAGEGGEPVEIGPGDADVIWRYDMRDELGAFPHNITSNSCLVVDGRVYVSTSNGVDWSHINIPNPLCPSLIVLDAATGELLGEEGSGIGERILHCNWSSPSMGRVGGADQLFFAAGDGFLYGFSPEAKEDEDGYRILPELWRIDGNPASYRVDEEGNPRRYATAPGPSEFISTPVFHDGLVYCSIGQDPEHGEGVGALSCVDPSRIVDGAPALVWRYTDIDRAISTVSVHDGLVYAGDYSGRVHCLDAKTGEVKWVHDTLGHIWGSTLVADGKVLIGNEDGILTILRAGPEREVLAEVEFGAPIYSSPIHANGVLYVATQEHLFAFATDPAVSEARP